MGQKVNPHGLRVGVIDDWDSKWYAGKDFADDLIEDHAIREFLKKKLYDSGVSKIEIERAGDRVTVTVNTSKPGMVIGKGGAEIDKVKAEAQKLTKKKLKKNTAYKFYVVAQKKSGGSYKNVAKSRQGHFFTGNVRGSYTNPKNMKLSKYAYNLKKGKSATIKASVSKARAGKKLATNHAAKLRFTSNNPKVATVNAKGKVTAKAKGTAIIYVQTINGIWKTCKVTVK